MMYKKGQIIKTRTFGLVEILFTESEMVRGRLLEESDLDTWFYKTTLDSDFISLHKNCAEDWLEILKP